MAIEDGVEEHEGETALRRSLRPILLLAPLTLAILVPAVVYGWYSSQAANEAFDFVERALISDSEGTRIDPETFCPNVSGEVTSMAFHQLAENTEEARASLSNLGFGAAVVDFKGWLDEPAAVDQTDGEDSSSTNQDLRDDITISVTRNDAVAGEPWCIDDIAVRTSSDEAEDS